MNIKTIPVQQQRLVVILLAVIVCGLYGRILANRRHHAQVAQASEAASACVSSHADVPLLTGSSFQHQAQRDRLIQTTWRRDPFSRGADTSVITGLHLSGILWDAQNPMAIINGRTVRLGEEFDGYQVTEITSDRVLISDGTDTLQLRLSP